MKINFKRQKEFSSDRMCQSRSFHLWMVLSFMLIVLLTGACGISIKNQENLTDEDYWNGFEEGVSQGFNEIEEPVVDSCCDDSACVDNCDQTELVAVQKKSVYRKNRVRVVIRNGTKVIIHDHKKRVPLRPSVIKTTMQVNANGETVIVNMNPDHVEKEQKKAAGKFYEEKTSFPKGVAISCYGDEPFANRAYYPDDYLTELRTPTFLTLLLSVKNADELEILGEDESGLEQLLFKSMLTFTVSRIEQGKAGTVVRPVKTYTIANPMPVDIKKMGYSDYAFKVQLNPLYLDATIYEPGVYAITDIWLKYRRNQHHYRKISGVCPKYHFSVDGDAKDEGGDSAVAVIFEEDDEDTVIIEEFSTEASESSFEAMRLTGDL